jgi:hypothetical protein
MVSVTPRPRFVPGEMATVSIGQEAGWVLLLELVWLEEKSIASAGERIPVIKFVVRNYTH